MLEHETTAAGPNGAGAELASGPLEQVAWLSPSCVLVVGDVRAGEGLVPRVSLVASGERQELACIHMWLEPLPGDVSPEHAGSPNGHPSATLVLAAVVPGTGLTREATLSIGLGPDSVEVDSRSLRERPAALKELMRAALAPRNPGTRDALLDFLAGTLAVAPRAERHELSAKLTGMREALRERLPTNAVSQTGRRGIHIDQLMEVDERSFYVEGWMHSEESEVVRLTAVSPEGGRVELLERLSRHPRPDVTEFFGLDGARAQEKVGFVCFFELPEPSLQHTGWLLELETDDGLAFEVVAPAVLTDKIAVRQAILNDPYIERLPDDELMAAQVFPAVSRIQERLGAVVDVASVVQYGTPPEAPEVSIVVPVYQQLAHIEAQLAEFADDPEMHESDLVYVLDSPEQEEALRNYAADLYPIYRVPFRIAILERNAGFPGACNAGASLAAGRLLLLLNSDILPDRPGWLGKMRAFYDATPNIGALGPKLLYEDDSIQHAGMHFYRLPGTSTWVDAHYYKGMHRSLPQANVARVVPIVSGACLMVDRGVYERTGGLRGIFVQGDYEDSDFCLHLAQDGLDNWYTPDAELYHLEGQSYAPEARRPANRYNMWLHTHIWGSTIETIMARAENGSLGEPGSVQSASVGGREEEV